MSEIPHLDDSQQAAIDAYLSMDSGLVTLSSVPGAGKSTVASKAVAAELLQRVAAGDRLPHERIVSISFSKEDASQIIPDVIAWIETLNERGETPRGLSDGDIRELIQQVRESPRIGTVDSLLRSVFTDIATELGFDGMPTVGNTALCTHLHDDIVDWLASQPELQSHFDRLTSAYPEGDYAMGVSEILQKSFTLCRRYAISTDEFVRRLKASVTANYRENTPPDFEAILDSVRAYRGSHVAADISSTIDAATKTALVAEDQRLYDEWMAVIDALGTVLNQYSSRYDELCIDRGIVSHLDCAYWVNQYFSTQSDSLRCDRLLRRYQSQIESLVIDEAQDISQIQHDALSHLVGTETRILLAGDLQQCIYQWRDANPTLFERAITDGEYFGRQWSPHTAETATQNYRSRPGIVRFANAVADRTLDHPDRGGLRQVGVSTPSLQPNRVSTDGPALHIARFTPKGPPGTDHWVDPKLDGDEARILVNYVAGAVENGRLTDEEGELPSITVLFDTRRHMDTYASEFEDAGFSVANASAYLFDSPVVCTVVAVLDWLTAPTNHDKTKSLLTESPLAGSLADSTSPDSEPGFDPICSQLADIEWCVSEAIEFDSIGDERRRILRGLSTLVADARRLAVAPAAVVVREIIDQLHLEADPLDIDATTDRTQRVATLDRLISLVEEWEGDDRYTHRQLSNLLEPFVDTPRLGPVQPVADVDGVDVVFKTIHGMKGDEDDIVIVADTASQLGVSPMNTRRLATVGGAIAIAPPVDAVSEDAPTLPVVTEPLYSPDTSYYMNTDSPTSAGLRWRAEHWPTDTDTDTDRLLGPPVRQAEAAATRAESWRKLYVALTRACEHLILPLPSEDYNLSESDHWAQVLYSVIGRESISSTGIRAISLPGESGESHETELAINDVPLGAQRESSSKSETVVSLPPQNGLVPSDVADQQWLPRFLRPSTLGPQVDDRVNTLIPTLRNESLRTDTEAVSTQLPLSFETVTTNGVGHIVHDLVGRLIKKEVPAESVLCPVNSIVTEVVEDLLSCRNLETQEAEGLREFIYEWILPDLGKSDLWRRVDQAETIYIEEPLQALTRVNNVDIEVHGQADLLLEMGDGRWYVEDIKTTLSSPTPTQIRRSKLQVDAYAWILDQQSSPEDLVIPRITTVGVEADEYSVEWPIGGWQDQLVP